jgi:hypothetical protein
LDSIKKTKHNGLIAVGRTDKPPVIDGKLDDSCWRNAVTITPFLLQRQSVFAKEQTRSFITYDDKNIYIGFKCYARVLDPAQNRLHEFANKIKENDSQSIFKDDCVIVLFGPDSKHCYEVTANANGAITDAKCTAPDYWTSRDLKWNSGAKAAGMQNNGFWSVEIVVPRAAIKADLSGEWSFLVGRVNQAMKETSAFNVIKVGFHDKSSFGTLSFKESVSAVGLGTIPAFSAGNGELPVRIGGTTKGNLFIEQIVQPEGKKPELFVKKVSLAKKVAVEAPLKVPGGHLTYRVLLRDAATASILLETPKYSLNPVVSKIIADVKSPEKFQFFVNEKSGMAQLNQGLNVLALKAAKGTSGKFNVGAKSFLLDSTWKFSPNQESNWKNKKFTAANWKAAPVKNGILQQSGYLRKIVFVDATELWPNWSPHGVNICRGSLQQFFFPPRGLKGIKSVDDFKLNIELPFGFDLVGASSYYNLFKASVQKSGFIERNGVKYCKYQISLPDNRKYLSKLPKSHENCVFVVRAPRKYNQQAYMYYYASANDTYIEEVPARLKINLLPELSSGRPEKIIFQLWVGWLKNMTDIELQKKVAAACKSAGFNEIQKLAVPVPGMRNMGLINFMSWNLSFVPFISKHPDMALVDAKGQRSSQFACPTALLNEPAGREYLENATGKWLKKRQVKHVTWDYEHSPFHSYITCFCPRCLKAFGHGNLTSNQIENNYAAAWIDFMTGQMAGLAGRLRGALRKADPQVVFSVYSGYEDGQTKRIYGVDWSKLNGKIDIAMCGYGRSQKILNATYKAIGDTELILGAISRPYSVNNRSYPTECSAAMLMRRLLDSRGGGVLVYFLSSLDGRTFHAVSEVSSIAAEYEEFFRKGKLGSSSIKGEHAVLRLKGRKLIILLNQRSKPETYKIGTEKVVLQPGAVKAILTK